MRDLNKPKYEALLKCCKSQGFHLEHDTINNDNCEEIISPFIPVNTIAYEREGLCFCNKKLKNVFVLQCYNKVFIECGSNCLKTVFGSEDEIKKRANSKIKKDFLDGTLYNRLGFEKIDDYERYIIEVITRLVSNLSTRKLLILKVQYNENDDIVNIINDELLKRQRIEDEKREERKRLEREEKERMIEYEEREKKRLIEEEEREKQRLLDIKKSKEEYERQCRLYAIRKAEAKKRQDEYNKWLEETNKRNETENNKLQDYIKKMREDAINKAKIMTKSIN